MTTFTFTGQRAPLSVIARARGLKKQPTFNRPAYKDWDFDKAMKTLGFHERPLPADVPEGTRGDSAFNWLRVDQSLDRPGYVYLHELAHLVLGHTTEKMDLLGKHGFYEGRSQVKLTEPRQEVEADLVAIALAREFEVDYDHSMAQAHLALALSQSKIKTVASLDVARLTEAARTIVRAGR